MVEYLTGVLEIANVFLSVVAGVIAVSLFRFYGKDKSLKPWIFLIVALVLFAVEEILGALRSFGIFSTPYLTHIVPTFILSFMIAALVIKINMVSEKGGTS